MHDLIIVGGGIIGVATAFRYTERFPDRSVLVLEKESALAQHQTGRNSGVLHSGIYYSPGSLKAVNCRDGRRAMVDFCQREGLPYEVCGKVIVAVTDAEIPRLEKLHQRGQANGVRCESIQPARLRELEPYVRGVRALHVPDTGIVDFAAVCRRMALIVTERGGAIETGAEVLQIETTANEVQIETTAGNYVGRQLVNCAGLHSDRVARLSGSAPPARIIPFRGEYFELCPQAHHLVNNLIYPVPDPVHPFLGVHFTRTISGGVECGPNAVMATAREGYHKAKVDPREIVEALAYPGLWRLARKYWRTGAAELWRSVSKQAFVRELQRLVPEIEPAQLSPAPSGVRAQAVGPDGTLLDDFLIHRQGAVVHVLNAPSPAATASLNIASLIVDRLAN